MAQRGGGAASSQPARRCLVCGGSLEGRRAHAVACSGRCRAELSRLRRLLAGEGAEGWQTLADRLAHRRG